MHPFNPETGESALKGAEQVREPHSAVGRHTAGPGREDVCEHVNPAEQRHAAQQLQISGHTVPQTAEDGDGDAFMPVRPRRARRKERQQLQQSLQGPYPSSGTEASMNETVSLLQPVSESQSCVLEEGVEADASLRNDEKRDEMLCAASCSSSTAMCDISELAVSTGVIEEGGTLSDSDQHAKEEKPKKIPIARELSGDREDPARRGSARGRANMRSENKPVYEMRRLYVPAHRLTPLRKQWIMLIEPLVTHLQLQVRMNVRRRCVELRRGANCSSNGVGGMLEETSSLLQKGSDYVRAFLLGFAVRDALALLRLDDLNIETFEVRDVKRLGGDHLSRCLARLSGKDGKTKFAIENATRTRLVIADSKIHILGSFENIRLARHACCSLILGAPPGKVYNHLRTVTRRLAERL